MRKILILLLLSLFTIAIACQSAPEPVEEKAAVEPAPVIEPEEVKKTEPEPLEEVKEEAPEPEVSEMNVSPEEPKKESSHGNSRIISFAPEASGVDAFIARKLDSIAEEIKALGVEHIKVIGYSSRLNSTEEENLIAKKRAESVAGYLMNAGTFKDGDVSIEYMGAREPLASHRDIAGRSKNRRVEIIYE